MTEPVQTTSESSTNASPPSSSSSAQPAQGTDTSSITNTCTARVTPMPHQSSRKSPLSRSRSPPKSNTVSTTDLAPGANSTPNSIALNSASPTMPMDTTTSPPPYSPSPSLPSPSSIVPVSVISTCTASVPSTATSKTFCTTNNDTHEGGKTDTDIHIATMITKTAATDAAAFTEPMSANNATSSTSVSDKNKSPVTPSSNSNSNSNNTGASTPENCCTTVDQDTEMETNLKLLPSTSLSSLPKTNIKEEITSSMPPSELPSVAERTTVTGTKLEGEEETTKTTQSIPSSAEKSKTNSNVNQPSKSKESKPKPKPKKVTTTLSTSTSTSKEKLKLKTKRTRQKSAQILSNEMQTYIYSNPRTTAYRAAHYRPSLETFQKVSFSHYIRYVLLGVDMETEMEGNGKSHKDRSKSNALFDDIDEDTKIQLMNEEPYYSDDSEEDVDGKEDGNDKNDKNDNDHTSNFENGNQNNHEEKKCNHAGIDDEGNHNEKMASVMPQKHDDEMKIENDTNRSNSAATNLDSRSCASDDLDIKNRAEDRTQKELLSSTTSTNLAKQMPPSLSTFKPGEKEQVQKIKTEKLESSSPSLGQSPPPLEATSKNNARNTRMTTRRMTTRSQTKSIPIPSSPGKENIYSKQYYVGPRIERRQRRRRSQELTEDGKCVKCTTQCKKQKKQSSTPEQQPSESPSRPLPRSSPRSKSKLKSSTSEKSAKQTINGNMNKNFTPVEPKKLDLDSLKLSDGIGKITPPVGWWDHGGIGKDLTGRGKAWQPGTKLGDLVIPQPIKQCAYGIGGVYDFTMMELAPITVAEFRKEADEYRKRQIGSEYDDINDVELMSDEQMDLLARKFWRRLGPTMESSKYGADMEGSLFDGDEACGWNVDQLDSCLQLLLADVNNKDLEELKNKKLTEEDFRMPGVTSAYLYFGMWASVFCAHTEDMNLLSINYLHAGAPKYWYAISPKDSGRFESLMASLFSHQSSTCKEFLRHKRSLVSPSILTKAGIEYTTQVQRAGDIIITYPGSYHFGFNTGFNIAESTNFAVPEWIPLGDEARVCMCHPHSVRIEMKRFKSLLSQYESDGLANAQNGRPKATYSQWARDNVKSKVRKRQRQKQEDKEDQEPSNKVQKTSRTSKGGMIVEVMKLLGEDGLKSTPTKQQPSSKKRKSASSKTKKKHEKDDFRIALKMRKSSLCHKKQTAVLCLLECGQEYHYFAGNVSAIVEDHARIHFVGSSRGDDIWLPIDSENLFLDGGSCEKPLSR